MGDGANFEKAVKVVLSHEGGYVNRASDPGGETKFGISQATYPNLDIKSLTEADAKAIYRADWWDHFEYGRFGNHAVALKVFDHALNIGWMKAPPAPRAHVFLQMAVNDLVQGGAAPAKYLLKADGLLGDLTFEAANAVDPTLLTLRFLCRVHRHYKVAALAQPEALNGWENRLWGCL